jgi:hypothetical protein
MRGENTVDPQAPQLTATGQTLGTLEYMSPEQLMGKQLDGRSDVYALGVLSYELLTGRLPFPDAKGPAALITAQLKQTPKPPSQANPGGNIPAGVDRIVAKTLEKNKDHRFLDVAALAAAAQECIASGGAWGTEPPAATAAATAAASGGPGAAPSQRNRGNPAMVATTRGDPSNIGAPPVMPGPPPMASATGPQHPRAATPQPMAQQHAPQSYPSMPPYAQGLQGTMQGGGGPNQGAMPGGSYPPHPNAYPPVARRSPLIWIVVGVLLIAAGVGAALAMTL